MAAEFAADPAVYAADLDYETVGRLTDTTMASPGDAHPVVAGIGIILVRVAVATR